MAPRDRIDTLRERIRESDDVAQPDAAALLDFSDKLDLLGTTYSDLRHDKLLRHCTRMAEECGGLSDALDDRDAAETIVAWINRTYDNEETNRDYRVALRVFGKRVAGDNGDPPDSIDWVPSSTSSNYDPSPDPREMLHWEDHVIPMIEACQNNRDRAMIAIQFDAGLRGGEFKDLVRGDVQNHDYGLQVTVDGKTGRKTVTLIPAASYVSRWLADHPGNSPKDPMWCKLDKADSISDRMIYDAFEAAADRAGVNRPVTLTNFRKSSAAFLATRNLNQAHIEDHHGWVRGSKVASRYITVFGGDTDRELAKIHGIDVDEDEPDPIGPVTCQRCGNDTPRERNLCVHCGQAIDPKTAAQLQSFEERKDLSLANLPPEAAQDVIEVLSRLEDPEVRAYALTAVTQYYDAPTVSQHSDDSSVSEHYGGSS